VCNFATPNFGAGMLKRDRVREEGEEIRGVRREERRERKKRDH
jgi:hypothetical protein